MQKKSFLKTLDPRRAFVVKETFAVYLTQGLALIMLGSIMPQLRAAYGLDYGMGGLLISAQSIGFLLIGLLSGTLCVRLGQKRAYVIVIAVGVVGLSMLLISGQALWLLAAMLLTGLAKGGVTDYNNSIVSEYSGASASVLNLLHAFFAIGACLAPIVVLLCNRWGAQGWRIAMTLAIILSALTVVIGLFMRVDAAPQGASAGGGMGFLRERLFWQSAGISFFYQAVEASLMGWLTSFFISSGVMTESAAQLVTAMLWVSLLLGRMSCSIIAQRFRAYQMLLVMSIGMLGFMAMLVLSTALPLLLAATVGLGLCMSGMYGTSISNAGSVFSRYPICMGLFVTFSGIGGVVAPAAVGTLADKLDLRHGMATLVFFAALLVITAAVNARFCAKAENAKSA